MARFKKFENLLESAFKFGRHHFERKFHEICKIALSQTLFGPEEWATNADAIIQERGWKQLSKLAIGTAPRRFGKSVSLAKVVAALAYCMLMHRQGLDRDVYNITVFSTGRRASELFSDYVKTFMDEIGLMEQVRVVKYAMEKIVLERDGMRVIFMFLPANPNTYVFFSFSLCVCVCFYFFFQVESRRKAAWTSPKLASSAAAIWASDILCSFVLPSLRSSPPALRFLIWAR